MPKEHQPLSLSAIHIDLESRSVLFESDGETVGHLTLSEDGMVFLAGSTASPPANTTPDTRPAKDAPSSKERDETIVLSGRLRADPKEGRPDRSGNPTAWAPFAARPQEGEEPQVYSATFHRRTVPLVLKLSKGAAITVRGFARESDDPERMDYLSVVGLLDYPGKPKKEE